MRSLLRSSAMRWLPRRAESSLAASLLLAACGSPGTPPPKLQPAPPPVSSPASSAFKIGKPYTVFGKTYYPADHTSYDERGIASWYGPGFHALATANGETYNQDDTTAAHKTLPLPSWVEVENLDNGRKLIVRINDRGPFVDGRIIDLSRRSAQLLGVDKVGLARVRVRRVYPDGRQSPPALAPSIVPAPVLADTRRGNIFVQVAALSDPGRIAWLRGYLGAFGRVVTQQAPGGLTRLRLGPYDNPSEANTTLAQLRAAGYADARLINP